MLQIRLFPFAVGICLAAHLHACSDRDLTSHDDEDVYARSGWPTIHADSRNTDATPATGAIDMTEAWREIAGRPIAAGATVGPEGNVYVGVGIRVFGNTDPDCFLFALDEQSGEQRWCSGAVNHLAITSSPLIDRDGNLYHGDDRAMVSFTSSGEVRWQTPIVGFPISAQFSPDGHLFFITHIGRIYVLRRDSGELVLPVYETIPGLEPGPGDEATCLEGSAEGNCPAANTPSMDLDTGRFYFTLTRPGDSAARVVAMQYTGGETPRIEPRWENPGLNGGSASSPVISVDGSRLYVNDQAENLLALEAETGETIWTFALGFSPLGSLSVSDAGRIIPTGGPGDARPLALVDRGTRGEIEWEVAGIEQRSIAVQTGNDLAYIVGARETSRGILELFTFDAASGALLDSEILGVGAATVGTTMSRSGRVFVPTAIQGLYGFEPAE